MNRISDWVLDVVRTAHATITLQVYDEKDSPFIRSVRKESLDLHLLNTDQGESQIPRSH